MEKNKKGFVMYLDYEEHFRLLSDEELGQLLRTIYEYERTGEIPVIENKTVAMAFSFICSQLERDNIKYEKTIAKRKVAGKLGADSRWGQTNKDIAKIASAKNDIAKYSKVKKSVAKIAETEKDTGTETDTEADIHNEEDIADADLEEIINYITRDGQPRPPAAVINPLFEFKLSTDLIKAAINTALFRGHSELDYVCGILRAWSNKGFKTLDDLKTEKKVLKSYKNDNVEQFEEIYDN